MIPCFLLPALQSGYGQMFRLNFVALDAYIINRNPTLEESFSSESGYIKGNKELRYRPVGSKWDTDYEGIPLYNRNSDKFTDKELNKIGNSIQNYFRDKYDIRLISKLIS